MAWIADRWEINLITEPELLEREVELHLRKATLPQILAAVCRQLGVEVTRSGELYVIGALKPSDRAAIVRRVRRLKAADLSSVLRQVVSGIGAVQVFPDGLCIISDTVEVLDRVAAIIDQLEAAESVTWCVQLHILRLSDRDIRNLGLDVVPALDLAATLGAASQGIPAGLNVNLGATLKGLLDIANEKSRTMIVAEPLMLIVDGDTGTWQRSAKCRSRAP